MYCEYQLVTMLACKHSVHYALHQTPLLLLRLYSPATADRWTICWPSHDEPTVSIIIVCVERVKDVSYGISALHNTWGPVSSSASLLRFFFLVLVLVLLLCLFHQSIVPSNRHRISNRAQRFAAQPS